MSQERFTARIRWQADVDPSWELETAHPGFETAEDAALFANGFLEAGADELRLESGRLILTFTDCSSVEFPSDSAQIWCLPDDGTDCQVADDADFERASISIEHLSAMGFDGGFTQIKYGVTDVTGAQVDVAVELNETGNLSVTVESPSRDSAEEASFAFAILPRA
jgi:hypothetical protein